MDSAKPERRKREYFEAVEAAEEARSAWHRARCRVYYCLKMIRETEPDFGLAARPSCRRGGLQDGSLATAVVSWLARTGGETHRTRTLLAAASGAKSTNSANGVLFTLSRRKLIESPERGWWRLSAKGLAEFKRLYGDVV